MKRIIVNTFRTLIVSLILLSAGSLFAQPPGGGGPQGGQQGPPPVPNTKQIKEMVSNLSKEISLSKEQEASVLNIYTAHFNEVKTKTSGNAKPKREEMDALRVKFEGNVKALLSKEQSSKYDAYLKKQEKQQPKR